MWTPSIPPDAQPLVTPPTTESLVLLSSGSSFNVIERAAKRFRIRSKRLFITYPQVSDTEQTDQMTSEFIAHLATYGQGFLVWERHKNGGWHIHAYLRSDEPIVINQADALDVTYVGKKYHPNIQSVKSIPNTVKYLLKDNNIPIPIAMTESELAALIDGVLGTDSKLERIAKKVLDMPDKLYDIVAEDPGTALRHLRALKEFVEIAEHLKRKVFLSPTTPIDWEGVHSIIHSGKHVIDVDHTQAMNVFNWMQKFVVPPYNNPRKTAQMWITSPPNCGKTYIAEVLGKLIKVVDIFTGDSKFWDGYSDTFSQLCIIDEYAPTNCKPLSILNSFLEGRRVRLNVKGGTTLKSRNPPVIILSNYTPYEVYSRVPKAGIDALMARLTCFNFSKENTPLFLIGDALKQLYGKAWDLPTADPQSSSSESGASSSVIAGTDG